MNSFERDLARFNPHVVFLNRGDLPAPEEMRWLCLERMCMWYEIELITSAGENSGVYTLDQFLPAKRGVIYIRKPGMIVRGRGPYTYRGIVFDAIYDPDNEELYDIGGMCTQSGVNLDFLRRLRDREDVAVCLESLPPRIEVRNVERYLTYIENAWHAYREKGELFQMYARREVLNLITALLEETDGMMPCDQEHTDLRRIRRYIDEHYMEKLDLSRLAQQASMSREHLCRTYRRSYGMAPMEYLTSVRLFHAQNLLVATDQKIEWIVEQCGFSSMQYFYQQFRRKNGISPAEFRRRSRCV